MKQILIVTPYAPWQYHAHAANDLANPFASAVGRQSTLSVYAPDSGGATTVSAGQYQAFCGAPPAATRRRLFGRYPAMLRKEWSPANTREVSRLINELRPDHVHVEYLQPAEVGLNLRGIPWSITFHDITTLVSEEAARAASGALRVHRKLEAKRVRGLEDKVLRSGATIFTLSDKDREWVHSRQARAIKLPIGAPVAGETWSRQSDPEPTYVFAGAMWRHANESAALWLLRDVFPKVRASVPAARLRIVGERPSERLKNIARAQPGVEVVGGVSSLEAEYSRATAVVAPTLVSAGILLKAQRALVCGAPLVVNSAAARPLALRDGVEALIADDAQNFAEAMVRVTKEHGLADRLSVAGLRRIQENGSWDETAAKFLDSLERAH